MKLEVLKLEGLGQLRLSGERMEGWHAGPLGLIASAIGLVGDTIKQTLNDAGLGKVSRKAKLNLLKPIPCPLFYLT